LTPPDPYHPQKEKKYNSEIDKIEKKDLGMIAVKTREKFQMKRRKEMR